ncbi:MAG: hypothetical protein ACM3ZU_07460 [Bacteroidota bacterium]
MTAPVFIDTNVPMFAAGHPHPYREAARDTIRGIVSGHIDPVTDSEVLQENLYETIDVSHITATRLG